MPELDDEVLDEEPFGSEDSAADDKFREMRKAANKAAKLARDNAAKDVQIADLSRRVAFSEAGLTLSDKQRAALMAAHGDAELTREALRATAAELRFIEPDEPDEAAAEREAALTGQARIAEAHQGARPPAPVPPLQERIAQAETAGDWKTASELKAQMVAQMVRNGGVVQVS